MLQSVSRGLTVRTLAPAPSAAIDGVPVPLRRRETLLLALLALRVGEVITAAALAEASITEGSDPRATIQVQLSRLRRGLGAWGRTIITVPGGYVLDLDPDQVDTRRFHRLAAAAHTHLLHGRTAEALEAGDAALSVWGGSPLGGSIEGWAALEVESLEEVRRLVEEDRAEALIRLDPSQVVLDLQPLVQQEPLRERRWILLAQALAAANRQGEALRALQRCRSVLRDTLGIGPGSDVKNLELELLLGSPQTLTGSEAAAGFLPSAISRFVGRRCELDALTAVLPETRLLTLTGTGGTGKTRLALALVDQISAHSPVEAWFVELDQIQPDGSVAGAVAALVARNLEGVEPIPRAAAALDGRPVLLILDSCDHVLDGAAATASALLRACPRLKVIATSRQPLAVPGESVWIVSPLSLNAPGGAVSDAVALLIERSVVSGHRPDTEKWRADLETMARAVDGIPLALEIVAAQVQLSDPAAIATALRGQIGLLIGETRGGPARHATMRAALEWSATLTSADALTVLARCSVFRGGFTADAASAVVTATEAGIAAEELGAYLRALVRSSLLSESIGRYQVLEPVRQWAGERLTATQRCETAAAHGRWAEGLASDLGRRGFARPRPGDAELLEVEHPNLAAAVQTALVGLDGTASRIIASLGSAWAVNGRRETLSWAEAALAYERGPSVRARVLEVAAEMAGAIPDTSSAVTYIREAIGLVDQLDRPRRLAWAKFQLGRHLMSAKKTDCPDRGEPERLMNEARLLFQAIADPYGEAWSQANLGFLALHDGNDAAAADWYQQADDLATAHGLDHVHAVILREQAVLASRRGHHAAALTAAAAAVSLYQHQSDLWQLCNALSVAAKIAWDAGPTTRRSALDYAGDAVARAAIAGFGDNLSLTAAWIGQRAVEHHLDSHARAIAEVVVPPLDQLARLWHDIDAAVEALRPLVVGDPEPGSPIHLQQLAAIAHSAISALRETNSAIDGPCGEKEDLSSGAKRA